MDLDYILPSVAIPENGREIDSLDDKSETCASYYVGDGEPPPNSWRCQGQEGQSSFRYTSHANYTSSVSQPWSLRQRWPLLRVKNITQDIVQSLDFRKLAG